MYFQNEKSIIDADIDFFESRIKQYEKFLKAYSDRKWWNENMSVKDLERYFNRGESSIRKAIRKMCREVLECYKLYENDKVIISHDGVEWICKNAFRQKYLELLEKYKMELTEKHIEAGYIAGYIYDEFFGRN